MYKNKIINRLQRINHYQEQTPDKQGQNANKNQEQLFKSTRRGKLSLSKDLSHTSIPKNTESHQCIKTEKSESKQKRKYLQVVSGHKDHSMEKGNMLSSNNLTSSISLSKYTKETPKRKTFFEDKALQEKVNMNDNSLKEMAVSLAKSAAILKEKIVPVLLQAANQSSTQDKEDTFQTPVRLLKASFSKEQRTVQRNLKTQGSENNSLYSKYKSKHEIQRSPAPIKIKNHIPQTLPKKFSISSLREHTRSESFLIDDETPHPLACQLESINIERIELQNRISRKLDELSQRTISMTKQEVHLQPNPKKHRILCLNSVGNLPQNSIKLPTQISQPKKMRNEIMNRIFS